MPSNPGPLGVAAAALARAIVRVRLGGCIPLGTVHSCVSILPPLPPFVDECCTLGVGVCQQRVHLKRGPSPSNRLGLDRVCAQANTMQTAGILLLALEGEEEEDKDPDYGLVNYFQSQH